MPTTRHPGAARSRSRNTYTPRREALFRRWLVSLPEGARDDVNAPLGSSTLDDSNSVILVGAGSLGDTADSHPDRVTRAYLTPVGETGRQAWWIGPENHKARIDKAKQPRNLAAIDWEVAPGDTAEVGIGVLPGFGKLDSDGSLSEKLATRQTLRPAGIDADAVERHFFDLTPASHGVLASVRTGHLKKDLSLLFEKDKSDQPEPYRFESGDIREPSIRPMSPEIAGKAVLPERHFAPWTRMRHLRVQPLQGRLHLANGATSRLPILDFDDTKHELSSSSEDGGQGPDIVFKPGEFRIFSPRNFKGANDSILEPGFDPQSYGGQPDGICGLYTQDQNPRFEFLTTWNWIQAPPFHPGQGLYISQDPRIANTQRIDCPYEFRFGPLLGAGKDVDDIIHHRGDSALMGPELPITAAPALELPSAPIGSLAGFAGMRVNPGWTDLSTLNPDWGRGWSPGGGSNTAGWSQYQADMKATAYQSGLTGPGIGNSFLHPMIPRTEVYRFFNNSISMDMLNEENVAAGHTTTDTKAYCDYRDHVLLLNDALWDDYFVSSLAESDLGNYEFQTPEAAVGSRFAGIPGYVIQSDLLKPIANTLSVRDDTFRIRAYGEAVDENGEVIARARGARRSSSAPRNTPTPPTAPKSPPAGSMPTAISRTSATATSPR